MGLCKNSQISKMGKTSFKRKNYHFEEVLDLAHNDLLELIARVEIITLLFLLIINLE